MIRHMERLGDRLLSRVVPKATAEASQCVWQYQCGPDFCVASPIRRTRRCCTLFCSSWEQVGCCQ